MNTPTKPISFIYRLKGFIKSVFPLSFYGSYALLWALSMEAALSVFGSSSRWTIDMHTLIRITTVLLSLFYLRIIDEQKDLEYDKVYNPDRPLVRGEISLKDLHITALTIAALTVLINTLTNSPLTSLVILLDLIYAITLMVLEKKYPRITELLITNLAITYPVQLLLSIYLVISIHSTTNEEISLLQSTILVTAFACAFLHFEFARKTCWLPKTGSRQYSEVLGPKGSAGIALLMAIMAEVLIIIGLSIGGKLTLPISIILCIPLIFPALEGRRFLCRQNSHWSKSMATAFLLFFYIDLLACALIA
ncbi:hypothetical protein [Pseudomonas aeruginosa]|uniref:hypothetical protein n=1 Tax=Pseudomonas aeruginosa TaxID=287 RepID=UPI004047007A